MVVCSTTGSAVPRVAAGLWIVAGVWYLLTEAVVARDFPDYSYSGNYISDLGRSTLSPLAAWMNVAFITQGLAFALASALVVATMRTGPGRFSFLGLALIYGAGSAVVGLFPSGGDDIPAFIHFVGAVAAILSGNLAVIVAGGVLMSHRRFRAIGFTSLVLGVAGLLSGGLLLYSSVGDAPVFFGDGTWERVAVYSIIAWQLFAGILLAGFASWRRHPTQSQS
ncbi:membrane protein [Mycolicibacterium cyprinidarum]|uniref:Membrane protein n=1 Tax=Mycolicibacterium cyprinidarum TaxID=2860311 RepID=A0ABQ4V8Y7_9MYCO|nr:membrane protein [Mycolicibacterium sp. NGTWSNA01]GJF15725.1 membrane protein [Mycolicibacterium sp. NGTWS0302]